MPLYEYDCKKCESKVEVLVRGSEEKPECPECGSKRLTKLLSVAAAPNTNSSSLPMASEPQNCGRSQCQSGCMFDR
ncbi:MAG: zinc ribbon domain-containing protein [Planctomycetota bacterium]